MFRHRYGQIRYYTIRQNYTNNFANMFARRHDRLRLSIYNKHRDKFTDDSEKNT